MNHIERARGIWDRRPFKAGLFRPLSDGRLELLLPEHPEDAEKEQAFIDEIRTLPILQEYAINLLRFDGWCRVWTLTFK